MAISVKFKPLDRTALFSPGGLLDASAAQQAIADFARSEIALAEATNAEALGAPPPYRTYVDGTESAAFETVKPGGTIVAVFDVAVDAVEYVYDLCRKNAPVKSGKFKNNIVIYADGNLVATPAEAIGAKEVVITDLEPYTRKIEGMAGKKPQSSQAPQGVFQAAAIMAASRFGNVASIKFGFRELLNASPLDAWAKVHAAKSGRRQNKQYRKDTRQPAVIITMR